MFERPPRQKEWVSWTAVVLWACFIFAVVPFARAFQKLVTSYFEPVIFIYAVAATVIVTGLLLALYLWRRPGTVRGSYVWLVVFGGFFIAYAYSLRKSPSEALHFIDYGVLGVLLFRAFSHRVRDQGIYVAAMLAAAVVGILDEAVQWITPGRFWGLGDIWIDCVAAFLVQGAIALGLRPPLIERRFGPRSIRLNCHLGIVVVLLLGASALNTPPRIAWYSSHVPLLGFVERDAGVMLEYGYLYQDPEIGVFRSRLSPEALKRTDQERGPQVAALLAQSRDPDSYGAFLQVHSPGRDPFVHEARVHLFRRDRYFQRAQEDARDDEALYREYMTIAYRENLIMEKYFSHALSGSGFAWPAETRALVERSMDPDMAYDSWVSRSLITGISEGSIVLLLAVAIAGLALLSGIYGRVPARPRAEPGALPDPGREP